MTDQPDRIHQIPIGRIRPNPDQPRTTFDDDALDELAASIKTHGIIQPVEVAPDPASPGDYVLHHGERRWRAAQLAGLGTVRAIVVTPLAADDRHERALAENEIREDMNPIDRAVAYQRLVDRYGLRAAAERIGKSQSAVSNWANLLRLPPAVQDHIRAGRLGADPRLARAILALPAAAQEPFADKIAGEIGERPTITAAVKAADRLAERLERAAAADGASLSHTYAQRAPVATSAPALAVVFGAGGRRRLAEPFHTNVEAVCRRCPWFSDFTTPGGRETCAACPLTRFVAATADHVEGGARG